MFSKALADSSSCMEAEKRLQTVQNCFQALRIKSKAFLDTSKAELLLPVPAKLFLLKMAQYECMGDIITTMRKETLSFEQAILKLPRQKRPHYLLELCKFVPFLSDEGLLRIGGRLQNAELAKHFKHPILLPYKHWTTELYIRKTHSDYHHFGADLVFGALQQDCGLWPVGGARTVRHYTRGCVRCRLRRQIRGEQLMAPLPVNRLRPRCHVFAYAASDLAGPFSILIGRSTVKRWLCVFVCMVTTAVRVKVAVDLSASTFINVFRSFLCSTDYRTQFLRTDNGTNFVAAYNLLKQEVKAALQGMHDSNDLRNQMQSWEVRWEFGPPEASHHGGIYERQIRTIRKALNNFSDLPSETPTEDEFLTCSKMAEYVINCRPLTKANSEDGLPPLRPIDLMVGALQPREDYAFPVFSCPRDELRRGLRYTQRITEMWWERWLKLYIGMLQGRQKWRKIARDFVVGDLILLCNEPAPRFLKYLYAIITEVKKDSYGHVRSVIARMSDGRTENRDITKIALIDSNDDANEE